MKFIQYDNQKTVLFISGMFAGSWIWDRSRPQIINSNHLVVEESLAGISGRVNIIVQMISEKILNLHKPVVIVGNSLGSLVALEVAKRNPVNVDQVLISGSAGFGEVALDVKLNKHNADAIADKLTDLICFKKYMLAQEDKGRTAETFRNNLRNLVGLIRYSNATNGEHLLKEVQCPVKAIWGREDVITPLCQVEALFSRLNIPLSILDHCGHSPMYENPTDFATWVNSAIYEPIYMGQAA